MASRIALSLLVVCLASCNVVETSQAPLDRDECAQLEQKFHEIFSQGLSGSDLEEFNSYRNPESEIAECLEEQSWDRAGFECAMKQSSQGGLQSCILRMR